MGSASAPFLGAMQHKLGIGGKFFIGRCPNGFLGMSLNDMTILFLVILLDARSSLSDKTVSIP